MSDPIVEVESAGNGQQGLWFERFEVGRLLGCGAFAKVYQARDLEKGEDVAIKVVSKKRLITGGFTEHVKREISAMRRLRHPNIVRLFQVLATKTKIYFIMELVKGGELLAKITRGRFSEELSRRYFQQLISVVRYCHIRGVCHRDLKPENLLIDEERELKVSDFGLSAIKEQAKPNELLHTLCGTPTYVAPEILSRKGYDGAKADIWSCGVILFVLSSGYLPFNDVSTARLYRKIVKGDFQFPHWTSPDLRRLITRLLDPKVQTRITLDEIFKDPWFKLKFHGNVKFHDEDYDAREFEEAGETFKPLNAFDIISSSSGLNLSGLFGDAITPDQSDRFASREAPETIMEKLEELAKELDLRISKRKEWAVRLEGLQGHLIVAVKLHRLTEDLIMVEVRNKGRDLTSAWVDAVRTRLFGLIHRPGDRAYLDYHGASL